MQMKEKEKMREIEILNEELWALKNSNTRINELEVIKDEQAEQVR